MTSTIRRISLLGMATLSLSSALGAQETDARWQAWIGCWTPVASQSSLVRTVGASTRVCVAPTQGTSAVEVTSIAAGKVVDRTRIEADGLPHPVSRDGCTGSETAHWSMSGVRVYVSATMRCAAGVNRRSNSVLSFTERYEWLDVRGMTSGKSSGVAASRFAPTGFDDSTSVPVEVWRATPTRSTATNTAIIAAAAPLTLADIADVGIVADSGVAAAWLIERTRDLKLSIDGKMLVELADAGVPPAVIDVAVALAHPAVFGFDPNSRAAGVRAGDQLLRIPTQRVGGSAYPSMLGYYPYGPFDSFYGYGAFNACAGYGYGGWYGYGYGGSYGCGGYGRYSPYYGNYYSGVPPIILVGGSTNAAAPSHGRVIKGQGYTSGSTSQASSPRSLTSEGNSSNRGASGSSGSGSSGGSSGSSDAGGSSGGGRTAVKKP